MDEIDIEWHHRPLGGHIQLILGPMFSGKTTELLRRIRRYTVAKRKVLVIKYEADKRYSDDCAATHDNYTHIAQATNQLRTVPGLFDADVIGIDEGQFYPDLLDCCESLANSGKVVIVAALDGTFQRKPFGHVLDLIPLAEKVDKLNAVCMICTRAASFTSRLGKETTVELIGGTDCYISTCRRCFVAQQQRNERASPPLSVRPAPTTDAITTVTTTPKSTPTNASASSTSTTLAPISLPSPTSLSDKHANLSLSNTPAPARSAQPLSSPSPSSTSTTTSASASPSSGTSASGATGDATVVVMDDMLFSADRGSSPLLDRSSSPLHNSPRSDDYTALLTSSDAEFSAHDCLHALKRARTASGDHVTATVSGGVCETSSSLLSPVAAAAAAAAAGCSSPTSSKKLLKRSFSTMQQQQQQQHVEEEQMRESLLVQSS